MSKIEPREFSEAAKRARFAGLIEVAQLLEDTAARATENAKARSVTTPMERRQSEAVDQLAAALAKAQGAMHNPEKDRTNTFFGSKYATMASVIEASRAALAENGLAYTQEFEVSADRTTGVVTTTLLHQSGQWKVARRSVPIEQGKGQSKIQAEGTAETYGRRYALSAMLGLAADEDEDGNGEDAGSAGEALAKAREQATARAAQRTAQQPPVKPPPVMPIGKLKGKPLAQVGDDDLTMAIEELKQKLEKEPNAEWAPAARKGLDAMGEELERRITAAQKT